MTDRELLRTIHMAQLSAQWERAKGELRALEMMLGARPPNYLPNGGVGPSAYQTMSDVIAQFVDRVEGEELQTGGCDW
jgi:hypothetical protein